MVQNNDPIRRRIVYTGRVQGVGFRATTRSIAAQFAVRGFVRNQDDGTVELVVEGAAGEVERFLAAVASEFMRHIRRVQNDEEAGSATFTGFEIRH